MKEAIYFGHQLIQIQNKKDSIPYKAVKVCHKVVGVTLCSLQAYIHIIYIVLREKMATEARIISTIKRSFKIPCAFVPNLFGW